MASQDRLPPAGMDLVAALDGLPDPVCRVDPAGRVVAANRAFHALFGARVDPDLLRAAPGGALDDALRGAAQSFEVALPAAGGRSVRLAFGVQPDGDGLLLVGRDVGALRSALDALADSHRRLQALMDALPVGVSFSDDPSCTRITGNAALHAQFAARPGENMSASADDDSVHGRQVRFFRDGQPVQAAELPLQRAVAENAVVAPMLLEVVLPDGRRWMCEASGAPIRDAHGAVIGGVALTIDVTERLRAQAAEHERVRQIARLADAAPGVLHAFRRGPDGHASFPFGGARVAALYGIEGADLAADAAPAFAAIHPEDMPHLVATVEDSARDLTPWHTEFRVRHPGRGDVWIEGHTAPLRDPDGGITWHGFVADVSARKRDEIRLREALVQLAARNRELKDFAFIASHDLQEPLRKIAAFSDKVMARHGDALDPTARDYLQRSINAAGRMQRLIADLLAYSRVLSGGQPFLPVTLDQVLDEVREDLALQIEETGARIEAVPLPVLHGDRGQLRQLLLNLVGNALKFRAPGRLPVIRIDARPTTLEGGQPGWRLQVADNGIGFEPRYAERIFTPFERLHDREAYPGTGIGLAIVQRIVERHQGRVCATGVAGEGATFTVELASMPRAPAGTASPETGILGEVFGALPSTVGASRSTEGP